MASQFDTILEALKGETVLVQPRVSRETIVYVLKEHTEMLKGVRQDMDVMKETAVELRNQAAENKRMMVELTTSVSENRKNIVNLDIRTNLLQDELEALRSKISEVNELRQLVKDQRGMIDDMRTNYEIFKAKTTDLNDKYRESLEAIDTKTKDIAFETKELKHTVDHFGDNLILSSTQITVESTAGFSKRPQSLLDVLKTCQTSLSSADRTLAEHTAKITENTDAIVTKADATVAFAVQTLDKDVLAIKNHLKKEEDQGISAIRRSCDNLTVIVEGLQASLVDKIDRNIAEIIVQKKYEDIVQYLQDALEASSEDEDNFKNVALELEEKIKKLASSKSDRIEIQPLQESLVKAEASIAKLTSQQREGAGKSSDEVYSKSEVNLLLDLKVDKESLEELVNLVIKSRRGKRIPGAAGGGAGAGGLGSLLEEMHRGGLGQGQGEEDGAEDGGGGAGHRGSGILPGHRGSGVERKGLGGFPSSSPGVFRASTEGGRPGGYSEKVNVSVAGAGSGSASGPGRGSSSVYGSSAFKGGVPTGLFPPANGAIALSRSANDLPVHPSSSPAGDREGYSPTRGRSESPERQQGRERDEYGFLGATTKGGGFNTRQQQAGRPPVINALSSASRSSLLSVAPEEGTIKGMDGHLYSSDEPSAAAGSGRPSSSGGGAGAGGSSRNPEVLAMKLNPPPGPSPSSSPLAVPVATPASFSGVF